MEKFRFLFSLFLVLFLAFQVNAQTKLDLATQTQGILPITQLPTNVPSYPSIPSANNCVPKVTTGYLESCSQLTDGGAGITLGSPTGGAEGAGSLNMQACYVNGVACATGGGISGLTNGFLSKASSPTTIVNSLCDEGITTVNTFTCSDSAGASFEQVTIIGSGAGAIVLTAGAAQGHGTASTITTEAPSSVTAYEIVQPGVSATGFVYRTNASNVDTESITSTTAKASGTAALGTSAISSGTCATVVTVAASGVVTTDVINSSFNSDPTGVTGYAPTTNGMLTIIPYPTSGNVNFKVCNNTSASITPGAITLNWRVPY